ncbi:TetR/AcrR family transcriptional regulator [bacterium]|nr:TetR/AcrR family transcriptional regulator [bacterium]
MQRTRGRTDSRPGLRERKRRWHEGEVLDAAERAFASRGFEAATMASLAAEAGLSIGTVYSLFPSKEAILERLLLRHMDALAAEVALATRDAAGPREKLEALVLARVRYLARRRDFFRLWATEVPGIAAQVGGRFGPAIVRAMKRQLANVRSIFEQLPGSSLDAGTRALLFQAATRAHTIERVIKARRPPRDEEVLLVVRGLLDGLA